MIQTAGGTDTFSFLLCIWLICSLVPLRSFCSSVWILYDSCKIFFVKNNTKSALPFCRTRRIFKVLECAGFSATHRMCENIKCIWHVQYLMSCLLMWSIENQELLRTGLIEMRKGDYDSLKRTLDCETEWIHTPWFQGNVSCVENKIQLERLIFITFV